jgi:hypothetical protein
MEGEGEVLVDQRLLRAVATAPVFRIFVAMFEFLETRFEAAVKVLVNEIKKVRKENQEEVGKLITEKPLV